MMEKGKYALHDAEKDSSFPQKGIRFPNNYLSISFIKVIKS